MYSSDSAKTGARRKRGSRMRHWVTAIVAIFFTLVVFLIVRVQGHVTGREFAPTHFQVRDFSFYEIPLLHIQITPIVRHDQTPPAARFVRQTSLISPVKGPPKDEDWHLVDISRGISGSTPAAAHLLVDQLEMDMGKDPYWQEWSKNHKPHAKVFWQAIEKLAKRELYVLMPALFESAQLDQSADQLAAQIDQYLQTEYHDLIRDMHQAEREDLAADLYAEAIADYPDNQRLQALAAELAIEPKQPGEPDESTTTDEPIR